MIWEYIMNENSHCKQNFHFRDQTTRYTQITPRSGAARLSGLGIKIRPWHALQAQCVQKWHWLCEMMYHCGIETGNFPLVINFAFWRESKAKTIPKLPHLSTLRHRNSKKCNKIVSCWADIWTSADPIRANEAITPKRPKMSESRLTSRHNKKTKLFKIRLYR